MRPLSELLSDDPAWPKVRSWIEGARNDVAVLPVERAQGEDMLQRVQVTSRSPLGAIALQTGGLLVDHGWLRILGAGSERMRGNLATWNGLADDAPVRPLADAFVVAHDAVGGFFALNGGAFEGEHGNVFYRAPDTLAWEDLERGYSDFLGWVLEVDLARFYESLRWSTWAADVSALSGDDGISLYPPPFTKEGRPVENAHRGVVPMTELWALYWDGPIATDG